MDGVWFSPQITKGGGRQGSRWYAPDVVGLLGCGLGGGRVRAGCGADSGIWVAVVMWWWWWCGGGGGRCRRLVLGQVGGRTGWLLW
jgi:hypothetical protein